MAIAMTFVLTSLGQSMPNSWFTDMVNPGIDLSLFPDTETVFSGDFSCKAVLEQAEVPYLFSFNYPVTEGENYTFSLMVLDDEPRARIKVYAEFYDADGNDIYGEVPVYSEDQAGWSQISWSGVVPGGAVEGYVWVKFYDQDGFVDEAIIYLDDVHFDVDGINRVANGSFELWDGVGIGEAEQAALQVFPNPFNNVLQIQSAEKCQVLLRTVLGQVVLQTENAMIHKVETSSLNSGFYFVTVIQNNKPIYTQKMIKQ